MALNNAGESVEQTILIRVILSGGTGRRLWLVSRETYPKPFVKLPDVESLLLKTLKRALATGEKCALTVTNRDYYFIMPDAYLGSERTGLVSRSPQKDYD